MLQAYRSNVSIHCEVERSSTCDSLRNIRYDHIPFETFRGEKQLEKVFRTPTIPTEMGTEITVFRMKLQIPFKSLTTISAISTLPSISLYEIEFMEFYFLKMLCYIYYSEV